MKKRYLISMALMGTLVLVGAGCTPQAEVGVEAEAEAGMDTRLTDDEMMEDDDAMMEDDDSMMEDDDAMMDDGEDGAEVSAEAKTRLQVTFSSELEELRARLDALAEELGTLDAAALAAVRVRIEAADTTLQAMAEATADSSAWNRLRNELEAALADVSASLEDMEAEASAESEAGADLNL